MQRGVRSKAGSRHTEPRGWNLRTQVTRVFGADVEAGWSDSVLLCGMLDGVGQSLGRVLPSQGFIYIILMVTSVRLRENVEFKNKNTNAPNMQITRTEGAEGTVRKRKLTGAYVCVCLRVGAHTGV